MISSTNRGEYANDQLGRYLDPSRRTIGVSVLYIPSTLLLLLLVPLVIQALVTAMLIAEPAIPGASDGAHAPLNEASGGVSAALECVPAVGVAVVPLGGVGVSDYACVGAVVEEGHAVHHQRGFVDGLGHCGVRGLVSASWGGVVWW